MVSKVKRDVNEIFKLTCHQKVVDVMDAAMEFEEQVAHLTGIFLADVHVLFWPRLIIPWCSRNPAQGIVPLTFRSSEVMDFVPVEKKVILGKVDESSFARHV